MSATIINFPVQHDAALPAWLAAENLTYILDRKSDPSPLVYDRENGRIGGSIAIAEAAHVYCSDRLPEDGQRLALAQAIAALPGILHRAEAYLRTGVAADGMTIRDSQHLQEASYKCWAAVDIAIARGDKAVARQWSEIAVALRVQAIDPLEAAISALYDA